MEYYTSSIEELKEIAKRSHRKIEFQEFTKPANYLSKTPYSVRKVSIIDPNYPDIYFISMSNTRSFSDYAISAAFVFTCNISLENQLIIRKRNILDHLSFKKPKTIYTGNSSFDKAIVSKTKKPEVFSQYFSHHKVQEKILDIFNMDERIHFCVNPLRVDFVSNLIDKSIMGFFLPNTWIFEPHRINLLFETTYKIKNEMDLKQ